MPVIVRSFQSPTLVLLAFDWPAGDGRPDFLGFAIERTPGFAGSPRSWLPNRIGFDGPKPDQGDLPSNEAPIQKFYWWDARINTRDRGATFSYRITPVLEPAGARALLEEETGAIDVRIPAVEEHGITTHFNRAVVSSQAFGKQFPSLATDAQREEARAWLANGMERAVPEFLRRSAGKAVEGAIYHLTDSSWIVPAFKQYGGAVSLVYNHTTEDHTSDPAIDELIAAGKPKPGFLPRTRANIMHDKFLVRVGAAEVAEAVLTGSANFTSEGLSAQANVLHAFESPELARLFLSRKRELGKDPSLPRTRMLQQGWSEKIGVGDAKIRVYFPPESSDSRVSLQTITEAVRRAEHSVLLCAYDPTDRPLLDAIFSAADTGKMMLALVNRVAESTPAGDPERADVAASIAIMKRSEKEHDIVGYSAFKASDTPTGFVPERVLWPGENPKIMVRVHHKFVVIDAEGEYPVVFTGSANFSGNSLHNNDENLLEITECPRVAGAYLAEFLRLFEHYRARMHFDRRRAGDHSAFQLTRDNSWSKKYFVPGSPEAKARTAMVGGKPAD
jgi:phosphatidylserine/phosphatidylglycerophosphate/cardiolipin synthase-like enzyme